MIFRRSREIQAIAGSACRKHSRSKGEIKRGRVANVRKSGKRGVVGANGPRIRRPRSMASRVCSSGNIEKSRRPPGPPSGIIPGERAGLIGGAPEMCPAARVGSSGDLEKTRRSPDPPSGRILGARARLRGASVMYRSRRKRGASGANGPRIRRPGSMVSRIEYSGDIEKSRRSPDSVYGCFLGARGRFPAGAPGMCERRRKRGASGANGPRIRRPGSMVSRLGSPGDLEQSRRSHDPPSGRILGARARLSGARQQCTAVGEKEALVARMSPESGGPDRWPIA